MSNFNITFTYPWLLQLLIPAAALVLFAYFRISKKIQAQPQQSPIHRFGNDRGDLRRFAGFGNNREL